MKKIYITPFIHVKDIKVNCILAGSDTEIDPVHNDIPGHQGPETGTGDGDDSNAKGGFIHFGFDE